MTSSLYPVLVPLAPLIAALLTAVPRRYLSYRNYQIGFWILLAGLATSVVMLWQAIHSQEPTRFVLFAAPWKILPVVELSIDRLAAVMMVVISGFGALLYRYSTRYLQQDGGQRRYQTLLALSISTLLFMVSSSDLLMLFISWQLLSWFLCLLSHNYAHVPTAQSSFRTFIMLRAGDCAFLAGIALAYHLYGTVQFAHLFERAAADQTRLALFGTGLGVTGATAVTLLIFIGAMSKSAQFPLHMWLPDSLFAPTPIHALLHAGIINAGGFLLNRLAPLYALSPTTLHVVLLIGLSTAILGTCMMLVQNDIKKTLGYSTIGQMGYMIMECGLGAFSLAVFHLIAHGLFKADVFLNCGKGIHEARLHPKQPMDASMEPAPGMLGWAAAFVLSFLVPLVITAGAHYALGISLLTNQGLLILLLFSWVTASQAMLTLFRLNRALLTKGGMLVVVALVATAYFFAAEQFTHFLIPDRSVVAAYFQAAALPDGQFLTLAALLVLSIVVGWFFSVYRQRNGQRAPWPVWLKVNAYLFFLNRLYLDGIALRLLGTLKRAGRVADQSQVLFTIIAVLSLSMALGQTSWLSGVPSKAFVKLLLSGLLIPLFPLHAVYVAALTRLPRALATALGVLLPMMGMCAMIWLLPDIPKGLFSVISVLAVFGALWGSVKALVQVRVSQLLAYGGLALYSILWWHFAQAGKLSVPAILCGWTVTLAWAGLSLAWDRICVRYGELDLNRIGGLFQPMPRFALCVTLLVMAAAGLPPFGLFFGYLGILLSGPTGISIGLAAMVATWFAASWYLFRLMQQLLFGPYRSDLHYEDLRPLEIAAFVIVIVLLVIPSGISQGWLSAGISKVTWASEATRWIQ